MYTLSKETVDSMTGFTAFSMVDTCIYAELVDQMSGYDIEYKGNKYSIERKEEDSAILYRVIKLQKSGCISGFFLFGDKRKE